MENNNPLPSAEKLYKEVDVTKKTVPLNKLVPVICNGHYGELYANEEFVWVTSTYGEKRYPNLPENLKGLIWLEEVPVPHSETSDKYSDFLVRELRQIIEEATTDLNQIFYPDREKGDEEQLLEIIDKVKELKESSSYWAKGCNDKHAEILSLKNRIKELESETSEGKEYSEKDVRSIIHLACNQFNMGFAGREEFIDITIDRFKNFTSEGKQGEEGE